MADAIRKVHDFLTVGAPAPLQAAGVAAMDLPPAYYADMATKYGERRDVLCDYLARAGFSFHKPDGAYYVLTQTDALDRAKDDVAFARRLVAEFGVASVPGSSFYADPRQGAGQVRFAFPKQLETLHAAGERLLKLGR
jgi:aminotransferase